MWVVRRSVQPATGIADHVDVIETPGRRIGMFDKEVNYHCRSLRPGVVYCFKNRLWQPRSEFVYHLSVVAQGKHQLTHCVRIKLPTFTDRFQAVASAVTRREVHDAEEGFAQFRYCTEPTLPINVCGPSESSR